MATSSIPWKASLSNPTRIPANADLNDYKTEGCYYVQASGDAAAIANSPVTTEGYVLLVLRKGNLVTQILPARTNRIYLRIEYSTGFRAWHVFEGTEVT